MGIIIKSKPIKQPVLLVFLYVSVISLIMCSCKSSSSSLSNCFNCKTDQPDSALVNIKVTINNENPKVPVTIYRGRFNPADSSNKLKNIIINANDSIYLPVGEYYSVKAKYKSGQKIIYAVDGGNFETQEETDCDTPCWQIVGGVYDVRLIY